MLICRDPSPEQTIPTYIPEGLGVCIVMVYWKSQRARSSVHFLQYHLILPLGVFP